jgi:hypothetical protein
MKPTTLDELERWLSQHAEDIDILDGNGLATLAQLDRRGAPGRRTRAVFRDRWQHDGWLPALTSEVVAMLTTHPGSSFYEGPCPFCNVRIRVPARPGAECPVCDKPLLGRGGGLSGSR